MKDTLSYILSKTIPETTIEVEESDQDGYVTLTATVPQEFMGKMIGKGGKNINAIKNLLKIIAIKENKKVEVNVVEKA